MTKSLSKAIALATLVGATASAQAAMSVNPNGLGEVLLYSLYTAEEGNITNINITNTTNVAKAVKVRFVEGQNSQEVLDFNLYLSPRDQWSGAVTATADGAKLISADKSCTVPAIPAAGEAFRARDYKDDGGEQSLARTRVGHLEVIEMGTIIDPALAAAVTAGSKPGMEPANCGLITRAFAKDGVWHKDTVNTPNDGIQYGLSTEGKGGLYGTADILNIDGSTQISYDATAIRGFLGDKPLHAYTGSIYPSLNGDIVAPSKANRALQENRVGAAGAGDNTTSREALIVKADGTSAATVKFGSTIAAMSALLAKTEISNNFVLDEARGSETNWVVTFPTKRFHVDADMENGFAQPIPGGGVLPLPPFTNGWVAGESCQTIEVNAWDNEEYTEATVDFSPSDLAAGTQLCYETNILTFNDKKMLGGKFFQYDVTLAQPDFQFGWMSIDFNDASYVSAGNDGTAPTADFVNGLPVIGFSAVTVKNNNTDNGLANNYGSSTNHKAATKNSQL